MQLPQHGSVPPSPSRVTAATRAEAFSRYQLDTDVGRDRAGCLRENKQRYRDAKSRVTAEIDAANEAKKSIDSVLLALEEHRARREQEHGSLPAGLQGVLSDEEGGEFGVDERESGLLAELKQHKRTYRMHAAAVPPLKNKLTFLKGAVSRSREELVRAFQMWWEGENAEKPMRASTANGGSRRPSRKKKTTADAGIGGHDMNISASTGRLGKSDSRAAFLRAKRGVYARK